MCYCLGGALGTLQIMVGLFNIGLGPGRVRRHPEDVTDLSAPYWLGVVFIVVGIVSVVPSCRMNRDTLIFSVTTNIIGCVFAIVACVLYSMDVADSSFQWLCDNTEFNTCTFLAYYVQSMLLEMDITLIVMAGLQLISSLILIIYGIMLLCGRWMERDIRDVDIRQPLLKNILLSGSAAYKLVK